MFFHIKELQYQAKPMRPDPAFARKLQEILGGKFGEMTVMMQYLFQGWNSRAEQKYRDLLLDTGTEEISHVEIVATLIARLLDGSPMKEQEMAAIAEIEAKEGKVAPGTFPQERERREFSYTFFNLSRGDESSMGRWASGPSMDGCGVFQYVRQPQPYGEPPFLNPAPPYVHDTPPGPLPNPSMC
ncbi:manganese catalase family protein [Bacillus sp. V5-8f]|uniref:manganese catalase family protein n=1 Tax=Bacillus sp. V5-8f TaxID=2053044 RepID=UPI000C776B85|nr:manganese catalase family protein [Bacillus sp. V5-8f]PLT35822.1 hypothetical protein CUU64_00675 [Bacillus sp. V5-8f]